jgi:hypothetical protein
MVKDKSTKCKRVKCKNWATDTCKNRHCIYAHEQDGYNYSTEHHKLVRTELGLREPVAFCQGGLEDDKDNDDQDDLVYGSIDSSGCRINSGISDLPPLRLSVAICQLL